MKLHYQSSAFLIWIQLKLYLFSVQCYLITGATAKNQSELFRSFILMSGLRVCSITKWVKMLEHNQILCATIGLSQLVLSLPPTKDSMGISKICLFPVQAAMATKYVTVLKTVIIIVAVLGSFMTVISAGVMIVIMDSGFTVIQSISFQFITKTKVRPPTISMYGSSSKV